MKSLISKAIRKDKKLFDSNRILFIIEFEDNQILLNKTFDEQLLKIINLQNIYYFKSNLNKNESSANIPGMDTYDYICELFPRLKYLFKNIENKFFYYIVYDINAHPNYINSINSIIVLFNQYNFKNRIIHLKKESFFHAICQNIYASNEIINAKIGKNIFKWKENSELIHPETEMFTNEFCKIINSNEKLIKKDLSLSYNFLMESNRQHKYLREEFIVLKSYLEYANINGSSKIKLGKENERWDAKIDNLLIEVTQAIPKNEFITRKHLAENMYGYKSFSLKLRTKHQGDLD